MRNAFHETGADQSMTYQEWINSLVAQDDAWMTGNNSSWSDWSWSDWSWSDWSSWTDWSQGWKEGGWSTEPAQSSNYGHVTAQPSTAPPASSPMSAPADRSSSSNEQCGNVHVAAPVPPWRQHSFKRVKMAAPKPQYVQHMSPVTEAEENDDDGNLISPISEAADAEADPEEPIPMAAGMFQPNENETVEVELDITVEADAHPYLPDYAEIYPQDDATEKLLEALEKQVEDANAEVSRNPL